MIITLAAFITGALIGLLLWSRLRTLAYRRPSDTGDALDHRPTHRWVLVLVPLCWAWLAWTLAPVSWWAVLLWLPLSVALAWASAVDLDVRRLPNRSLAAAGLWAAVVIIAHSVVAGRPRPFVEAVISAAACAVLFFVLHLTSRGGLGFGDVKLVAVLAAASAGLAGWSAAVAMILAGCLIALIGMAVTRRREIAFGPYLFLGAVATVGVIAGL